MHDGVSPHFDIPMRNYLNTKRPNNCTGKGRPASCPATPNDFCFGSSKPRYILFIQSRLIILKAKQEMRLEALHDLLRKTLRKRKI